ncbi:MAG: sigma-70 family RNA polymerase sigma factor [Clostridia bacterium]|nr:sigma-70 family RNA polymerase sigma factor [Clostridia bacterium]
MDTTRRDPRRIDEDAFVTEYARLVRRVIRPYFLTGGDYDDLYQEGMIGLLRAVRTYDAARNPNFEPYAVRCVRNRIFDILRAQKKEELSNQLVSDQWQVFAERSADGSLAGPEETVLASESEQEIRESLSGLLSAFEASVLDSYLRGYTTSEIALWLNRSAKSVDNAIRRIRCKLAHELTHGDSRNFPVRIKPPPRSMGTKER